MHRGKPDEGQGLKEKPKEKEKEKEKEIPKEKEKEKEKEKSRLTMEEEEERHAFSWAFEDDDPTMPRPKENRKNVDALIEWSRKKLAKYYLKKIEEGNASTFIKMEFQEKGADHFLDWWKDDMCPWDHDFGDCWW